MITQYDGQPVKEDAKFRMMVGATPIGKSVPVTVLRDGKEKRVNVTLAERPEEDVVASAPTPETSVWLGLHVEDAHNGEARRQFSLDRGQAGVVVTGWTREALPLKPTFRKATSSPRCTPRTWVASTTTSPSRRS